MADLAAALDYPDEVRRKYLDDGIWREELPWHWLERWAAETPDRPVTLGAGAPMTAADLMGQAEGFAAALQAAGLGPGDVVALQLPNVPAMMVAFIGAQRLGAVPAMVHMPYRAGEIAPMLRHIGARAVVCFQGLEGYDAAGTMLAVKDDVPGLEAVFVTGGPAPEGTISFEDAFATDASSLPGLPAAADPALILFTSGTSAAPKAVVHSYHTHCASIRVTVEDMGILGDDVMLCPPPFTHAFGITCALIFLCAGATSVLLPAFSPPALADAIREHKVTATCVGPAHIMATLGAGLWTPDVTDGLRAIYTGGAVCPPETVDAIEPLLANGKLFQVWGMTEVLMPICNRPDADFEERRNSLGQPPRGHDIRFVGDGGEVLPPDTEGELQMRGPFLFRRYLDNEKATAEAFTDDGFFRTGDLARMDANGRIYITGRAKDLINRGGVKINPVDIEALMELHPAVAQAAVIPYPDQVLGEKACLVIVPTGEGVLDLAGMRAWLEEKGVAKMRWPERLEIVDAMPMTPTRKIIKGKLAQQVLG